MYCTPSSKIHTKRAALGHDISFHFQLISGNFSKIMSLVKMVCRRRNWFSKSNSLVNRHICLGSGVSRLIGRSQSVDRIDLQPVYMFNYLEMLVNQMETCVERGEWPSNNVFPRRKGCCGLDSAWPLLLESGTANYVANEAKWLLRPTTYNLTNSLIHSQGNLVIVFLRRFLVSLYFF